MKYHVILFIAFLIALTDAKAQKDSLDIKAREVVNLFISSKLGIEKGRVDLIEYNQFKNLFDVKAMIQDGNNPIFEYDVTDPKSRKGTYKNKVVAKPFDEYAHDLALQVNSIITDTPYSINKLSIADKENLTYSVFRQIRVEKTGKYVLPKGYELQVMNSLKKAFKNKKDSIKAQKNLDYIMSKARSATYYFTSNDTLTITMVLNDDNSIKIKRVSTNGVSVKCINDKDKDGIIDFNDSLKTISGDFTANGMPDFDLDGVPDYGDSTKNIKTDKCKEIFGEASNQGCPIDYFITNNAFDGFVGLQFNSAGINLTELNGLGYNTVDVLQSKKGILKNPGLVAGLFAGVNYAYYFGKEKKKTGVSIGISYSAFTANYELTDSAIIYTFKSNDGVNDYRRRVTLDSLKERVKYNILNLPVMFSYRSYFGKKGKTEPGKFLFNLKAGPSLMLFNTTSEYDTYISFEGLYQTGNNAIIYQDPFDEKSTNNVYLTADSINAQSLSPGAAAVFNDLRAANKGYDFADSKNFRGKQKNDSRLALGFNLSIDMHRKITENWAFKFGAHGVFAPLPERKTKYIPIDNTDDSFNPIYNSSAKSSYSAFGANVGLVFNF